MDELFAIRYSLLATLLSSRSVVVMHTDVPEYYVRGV